MMKYLCFMTLIQTTLYGYEEAFILQCPFHSQWNLRAKQICNISQGYHCLYDANKRLNVEECQDEPQFEAPGYKIQIFGSFESVRCSSGRYQPFTFWTNGSNLCKFKKSICTSEGQILYSMGTTKEDRTCRCDYTKGYGFVVRPNQTCFCMPSKEDCTCFIRKCRSGFVLTPDYDCAPVRHVLQKSRCSLAGSVDNTQIPIHSKDEKDNHHDYHNVLVNGRSHIQKIVVLVTISILLLLVIGFCVTLVFFNEGICHKKINGYELQKLTEKAICKQTNEMVRLKDSFIRFEPTHASEEILLAITQNRCVLITGPFGSGKTLIAYYIISKLAQEGYEIIFASDSVDIDRSFNQNQRQLFLIDDILGKYASNVSDITDKLERCGSTINSILKQSFTVKVLITCRTYMFQLYAQNFESLRRHVSLIHKNLISENLRLNLEERRKMFKLYFESDPPKSISDDILLLYNFYPVMCSSNNKNNLLECFYHPVDIISAEIDSMRKKSDIGYLALAILVVMNNKVEISKLCGSSYSENTDIILRDILNESCFNQCPLKHMLRETFMSLKGEFFTENDTFLSFLCPELFDIVAVCIGGLFMQSILTHSSSGFIKEKLRLSQTQGNDCQHTVKVQHGMENEFYQRLTSDMNNNLFVDVLSNKLFRSPKNREIFFSYFDSHLKSKSLVDATTGSNVLHIISSLGYSDFLTYFLKHQKCPKVDEKDSRGETPLHLACQNEHLRCVQCLLQFGAVVNETDLKKRTALHYACGAGNEEIVKKLVSKHASMTNKDIKGMQPLHVACERGHLEVVKYLVRKKAYVNEADREGKIPLHYASKLVRCNIASILILNNASVNRADKQGNTPLHIANEFGNEEVVKLLIKHKAVTNCKNKKGLTPLDDRVTKQT